MSAAGEPRTEAGRALLRRLVAQQRDYYRFGEAILAIEAEAARQTEPRLDEQVRSLLTRAYMRGFGNGRYNNAPPNPLATVDELAGPAAYESAASEEGGS